MTELRSTWKPQEHEIKNFLIATFTLTIAFLAYQYSLGVQQILFLAITSITILLAREIGQRVIAQWMDAYIELEVSQEGLSTTFLGAIIAGLTGWGILLLFPIESKFSGHKYEHWGKSVDSIWAKRQYWLASGGIIGLIIFAIVLALLGFTNAANLAAIFALFQLLPFDYEAIPTGTLDGAYILRWSGFTWTGLMGITTILVVLL